MRGEGRVRLQGASLLVGTSRILDAQVEREKKERRDGNEKQKEVIRGGETSRRHR